MEEKSGREWRRGRIVEVVKDCSMWYCRGSEELVCGVEWK